MTYRVRGLDGPTSAYEDMACGAERAVVAAMHIISMLVIGLVIGALAKLVMPGRDPGGIIVTILIGIAGSMLAGFVGRELGWYAGSRGAGFVASILGAIVLLAAYRLIMRGRGGRAE